MCVVRQWNLLLACLTGVTARARLRELEITDPGFWLELTTKRAQELIHVEDDAQPEDNELITDIDAPISMDIDALDEQVDHDCDITMAEMIHCRQRKNSYNTRNLRWGWNGVGGQCR